MALIGYARVFDEQESLDPQVQALTRAGCDPIFQECISLQHANPPQLAIASNALCENDVFVVTKLFRLGGGLKQLIELIAGFQERGVYFRSVEDKFDTISGGSVVLQALQSVADFNYAIRAERSLAGQETARREGRFPGRRPVIALPIEPQTQQGELSQVIGEWLPVVLRMRPGHSWLEVCQAVNRTGSGPRWSTTELQEAVRRLVLRGLLSPLVFATDNIRARAIDLKLRKPGLTLNEILDELRVSKSRKPLFTLKRLGGKGGKNSCR